MIAKILAKFRRRYYAALLWSAYRNPESAILKRFRTEARILYGLSEQPKSLPQINREFRNTVLWDAQNFLFNKGVRRSLGPCDLGFNDLKVLGHSAHCVYTNLYLNGFYDELTIFLIYRKIISPGSIAIDVGANVGIHTVAQASLVGPAGRVWAFEPTDSLSDELLNNLKLNNFQSRVLNFKLGVGQSATEIPFNADEQNFNRGVGRRDAESKKFIKIIPLDNLLSEADKPISLIKIDVEGMEADVLRGARELVAKHKPAVVIEHNTPPWNLSDLISDFPYALDVFRIPNTFSERVQKVDPRAHSLVGFNNLLLVKKGRYVDNDLQAGSKGEFK